MSTSTILTIIIITGLGTFLLRFSFIYAIGRAEPPPVFRRGLRFVPVAVLPALVVPAILYTDGSLNVALSNLRLVAALIAVLVAWRTRNVVATIAAGMVALWILQWLFAG